MKKLERGQQQVETEGDLTYERKTELGQICLYIVSPKGSVPPMWHSVGGPQRTAVVKASVGGIWGVQRSSQY